MIPLLLLGAVAAIAISRAITCPCDFDKNQARRFVELVRKLENGSATKDEWTETRQLALLNWRWMPDRAANALRSWTAGRP